MADNETTWHRPVTNSEDTGSLGSNSVESALSRLSAECESSRDGTLNLAEHIDRSEVELDKLAPEGGGEPGQYRPADSEPVAGISGDPVKQESPEESPVWIPGRTIKKEEEEAIKKEMESDPIKTEAEIEEEERPTASEEDDDSEEEVGEEERLEEEESDEDEDNESDGGAYHLAEVSYGEDEDENSQKPGGAEPDSILGLSHDCYNEPRINKYKRRLRPKKKPTAKLISIKTVILKKVINIIKPDGKSKQVKHFKCPKCNYKSDKKCKVVDHTYRHKENKIYMCPDCDATFKSYSCLRQHKKTKHRLLLFDCNLCGRKCGKPSALAKHLRVHTGEKPFACEHCDYRSTQQNHIKVHMRQHTGEKPYKCNKCKYRCAYSTLLKKHMNSHTAKKKFACTQCDYKSKTNVSLQVHIKKHTGDKSSRCLVCHKSFRCQDAVKRHTRYMHRKKNRCLS